MSEILVGDMVGDVTELEASIVRKVSPVITRRGDRDVPVVENAFGLPAGGSCPGRTEFCNSCYAEDLEVGWPRVGAKLQRNFETILGSEDDIDDMAGLLRPMVANSITQLEKQGIKPEEYAFRIHWDGDFFSENYAKAWARVIEENPAVTFWVYTRSFVEPVDVVPFLVNLENLRLYLSADEYNNHVAQELQQEYGKEKVHIAYCAKSIEDARRLEGESRKARPCPENIGRISLVGTEQEDGKMEGACITCGICFRGSHQDIIFTTDHEFSRVQTLPFETPVHLLKTRKQPVTNSL